MIAPMIREIRDEADAPLGTTRGQMLARRLSRFAEGDYMATVDAHACSCAAGAIVFSGRHDARLHSLCLSTSTRARVLAHWDIYTRSDGVST